MTSKKPRKPKAKTNQSLEQQLWSTADTLRKNIDASEYKYVVLGLIFLKYISSAFEALYQTLQTEDNADPEDKDEYLAENVFFVPPAARWELLQKSAKNTDIGTILDNAMKVIEKENPSLKGILPKVYAKESELNKRILTNLESIKL